jgi:hypothetical protein
MDTCTWPADDRPYGPSSVRKQGKKAKGKEPFWDYPHLEHGSVNTVALIERHGRLEWTPIVKNGNGALLDAFRQERFLTNCIAKRLAPIRGPTKVFPDTRALPLRNHRTTVVQRAEEGVWISSYMISPSRLMML